MNQSTWFNVAILRTLAVEETGWKERQRRKTESERADGTITKLEEEADRKTGEGEGFIVNG